MSVKPEAQKTRNSTKPVSRRTIVSVSLVNHLTRVTTAASLYSRSEISFTSRIFIPLAATSIDLIADYRLRGSLKRLGDFFNMYITESYIKCTHVYFIYLCIFIPVKFSISRFLKLMIFFSYSITFFLFLHL